MKLIIISVLLFTASSYAQLSDVEHVLVLGIDGLGPAGIEKGNTPIVHGLMKTGAWTFHARGVMPTTSSPNWASMIMGAGPEQHGITSNEWPLHGFKPVATGSNPMLFPTIFGELRAQRPKSVIAVVHDWDDFARLLEKEKVDVLIDSKGEDDTTQQVIHVIKDKKPTLLFVQFDNVDHALHSEGFGTDAYLHAMEKNDGLIGTILQALKDAGIFEHTIVILTADHGGIGKTHGGESMQELEIPWIINGPHVAQGFEITKPVNTWDTACTIAYVLGIAQPEVWIGKPVMSAFK